MRVGFARRNEGAEWTFLQLLEVLGRACTGEEVFGRSPARDRTRRHAFVDEAGRGLENRQLGPVRGRGRFGDDRAGAGNAEHAAPCAARWRTHPVASPYPPAS